jgi:hypothetical protein
MTVLPRVRGDLPTPPPTAVRGSVKTRASSRPRAVCRMRVLTGRWTVVSGADSLVPKDIVGLLRCRTLLSYAPYVVEVFRCA